MLKKQRVTKRQVEDESTRQSIVSFIARRHPRTWRSCCGSTDSPDSQKIEEGVGGREEDNLPFFRHVMSVKFRHGTVGEIQQEISGTSVRRPNCSYRSSGTGQWERCSETEGKCPPDLIKSNLSEFLNSDDFSCRIFTLFKNIFDKMTFSQMCIRSLQDYRRC